MLLPEHRIALEDLVARIYGEGSISSDDMPNSVPRVASVEEHLTEEIVSYVRLQCAYQIRTRNRALVRSECQLPVELWAVVFEQLSQRDRIVVSHVSHDWRETALASGSLWNSPRFISSAHASDCECQACRDAKALHPCRSCGRQRRVEPNPVDRVNAFLARSGASRLALRVAVYARAAPDTITDFHDVVRPHAARLESLEFDTSEVEAIQSFLQALPEYPMLRSLTIGLVMNTRATWNCNTEISLPQLKTLTLRGPMYCDLPFNLHCPLVTSITAMFHHSTHIQALLTACPGVQDLLLEVGPRTLEIYDLEDILERLKQANPRTVIIRQAYQVDVLPVLRLFGATNIPSLKITSSTTELPERVHLTELLSSEVQNATRLDCVLINRDAASDDSGVSYFRVTITSAVLERTLVAQPQNQKEETASLLHNLWGHLSRSNFDGIMELHVSSTLWPAIFHIEDQPDAPRVTRTHVYLDKEDQLEEWLAERARFIGSEQERSLPQLEHLRFVGRETYNGDVILNEALSSRIQAAFGAHSKLHLLELQGFKVVGEHSVLESASHEVRLINCIS